MMAIEQFDELESRHTFLTTQRKDLIESIAQTTEAIKRIDETTRQRFSEAFAAININFQENFQNVSVQPIDHLSLSLPLGGERKRKRKRKKKQAGE